MGNKLRDHRNPLQFKIMGTRKLLKAGAKRPSRYVGEKKESGKEVQAMGSSAGWSGDLSQGARQGAEKSHGNVQEIDLGDGRRAGVRIRRDSQ